MYLEYLYYFHGNGIELQIHSFDCYPLSSFFISIIVIRIKQEEVMSSVDNSTKDDALSSCVDEITVSVELSNTSQRTEVNNYEDAIQNKELHKDSATKKSDQANNDISMNNDNKIDQLSHSSIEDCTSITEIQKKARATLKLRQADLDFAALKYIDVVGLNSSSNARTCVLHEICGNNVALNDKPICAWAVQVSKRGSKHRMK